MIGSGYKRGTTRWAGYSGPKGPTFTPGSGALRRKKSLGLQALENTMGLGNINPFTNPKIAGTTATSRNAALAKAQEIYKASQPDPIVSSETPLINISSNRLFRESKLNIPTGIGGPKIVKPTINKKNPLQREVKPVGGPVRL